MTTEKSNVFHDVQTNLRLNGDTGLVTRRQEIPDAFWDDIAASRTAQDNKPVGDFLHVASIPSLVIEEWYAQGFNIFDKNVTLPEILARLRLEDKDKLIVTSRSI